LGEVLGCLVATFLIFGWLEWMERRAKKSESKKTRQPD
jgi:predicted outer membrane lipoprotein